MVCSRLYRWSHADDRPGGFIARCDAAWDDSRVARHDFEFRLLWRVCGPARSLSRWLAGRVDGLRRASGSFRRGIGVSRERHTAYARGGEREDEEARLLVVLVDLEHAEESPASITSGFSLLSSHVSCERLLTSGRSWQSARYYQRG